VTSPHDLFRQYAAYALAVVYSQHPTPVSNLTPSKIVAELGHEVKKANIFTCQNTLGWLEANGYLLCGRQAPRTTEGEGIAERSFRGVWLTDKALAALDVKVDLRGTVERAGDVLRDKLAKTGGSFRDAVITEIVGRIIGTATKSFFGE
jgi:hypothetical protein